MILMARKEIATGTPSNISAVEPPRRRRAASSQDIMRFKWVILVLGKRDREQDSPRRDDSTLQQAHRGELGCAASAAGTPTRRANCPPGPPRNRVVYSIAHYSRRALRQFTARRRRA